MDVVSACGSVRAPALTKKGLRPKDLLLSAALIRSSTSPDEEGIKTPQPRPGTAFHFRSSTSPDEEGIKTNTITWFGSPPRSSTSPDEEGIKTNPRSQESRHVTFEHQP